MVISQGEVDSVGGNQEYCLDDVMFELHINLSNGNIDNQLNISVWNFGKRLRLKI